MKPWKAVMKQLYAEFLGTLLMVFVGCGSTTKAWSEDYRPTTVQIALAFGLIVTSIVQVFGHVSGAHVNPAVTAGLVVGGFLGPLKALLYVAAQCAGATAGALLLLALTPSESLSTLGATVLNHKVTPAQGCGLEMVITMVLVLAVYSAVLGVARGSAAAGSFTIGISITVCHLFALPYTGASMNPARSLGPAIATGSWANHWVYWVGPCVGGVAAGVLYKFFRPDVRLNAAEHQASPARLGLGVAEGSL